MRRILAIFTRKKLLHGLSMAGLFSVSLAMALFVTSIAPQMLQATVAEPLPAMVTETLPAETEPATETTVPETETETETTMKKSDYKAKTDVKVQIATGNKTADEDVGADRVVAKPENNGGNEIQVIDPVKEQIQAVEKSRYTDFAYANVSNLTGLQNIGGVSFLLNENHQPVSGMRKIGAENMYFNAYGAKASLFGIDVSQWNGKINWNKVKAAGVDFAIIRVGFRGYGTKDPVKPVMQDSAAEENVRGAIAAGIPVGLYFYSQAITLNEALEEAGACVNLARKYKITYPIYFDTEYATADRSGRADRLTKRARTDYAVAFCEAIRNAGYQAGVYASKSFYDDELQFSRLSGYPIWVAHYTSKETDFRYKYGIWQYSDKGKIDGIPNSTDINIAVYDYAKKSDMKSVGSNILLTDAAGQRAFFTAEQYIAQYETQPDENIYQMAEKSIASLSDQRVRSVLMRVLSEKKASVPTSESTTSTSESAAASSTDSVEA